jgi:predicted nucleic acid-binding protein
MLWLLDSNILLRLFHRTDSRHVVVRRALSALWARGDSFAFTSQILGEFWSVCSRPVLARGGFGLALPETDRRTRLIERFYRLLPDTPAVHIEWRRLLVAHNVAGLQTYDARIVATMNVHSVSHLLTLNVADFERYTGISVVAPQEV